MGSNSQRTQAQSTFSNIELAIENLLLEKGANPVLIVHQTTCYSYKGILFEVRLSFLGINKKSKE
jgi:hypothetical protein